MLDLVEQIQVAVVVAGELALVKVKLIAAEKWKVIKKMDFEIAVVVIGAS